MYIKDTIGQLLTTLEEKLGLSKPKVVVLCYHSVSDEGSIVDISRAAFAEQISWLKAHHFKFISLDEVAAYIAGKANLNGPAVALTFDDGYADLLTNVAPLLKKENIPAAVFVLADPENCNRHELENQKPLLSLTEIKKLHSQSWTIASHGMTHADLLQETKAGQNQSEIVTSKQTLETALQTPVTYFAYPKGRFNQVILDQVKNAGYAAAFSFSPGIISHANQRFAIPRLGVDHTHSLEQFKAFFTWWGNYYFIFKNNLVGNP